MKKLRTFSLFGTAIVLSIALVSSVQAQPAPGTGSGSAAAAGADGNGSAAQANSTGSGAAGNGSSAPQGNGPGSGAPTIDATNLGANGAGSGSGAATDAAAPEPPKPTKVTVVDCAKQPPKYVVKAGGQGYVTALVVADPARPLAVGGKPLAPEEIDVNDVVRFDLTGSTLDVQPDPPVEKVSDPHLVAAAGASTCLQFTSLGTFAYHASTGNAHGKLNVEAWYTRLAEIPVEEHNNFWMPKAVNTAADDSDLLFMSMLGLSAFFFLSIGGCIVYFTVKYRHKPGRMPEPSTAHNDALEITWTIIPTLICVFLFWYGWKSYVRVVTPPTAAVEINVTARQWAWEFKHSNGVTDGDLHVPSNTPVRLVMTSVDVLHSFYAPVMRVKQDIVPKRYTYAWFNATKPGTYRLDCAEYCGKFHSQMGRGEDTGKGDGGRRTVVVVHEAGKYEQYLADKQALERNLPPAELGKLIYEKNCTACHTIDGSPRVGPSFFHDFGTMVPLSDGRTIKMDENYIRRSVLYPQAEARPGYPPTMPSFEGNFKESDIQGVIAFIKSLQAPAGK